MLLMFCPYHGTCSAFSYASLYIRIGGYCRGTADSIIAIRIVMSITPLKHRAFILRGMVIVRI